VKKRLRRAVDRLKERRRKLAFDFNAMVDAELIVPFQRYVYYPVITGMTLYLAVGAAAPPQAIEENLTSDLGYGTWLGLGIAFPVLSLFGRHLYESAQKKQPGESNGAYGGAIMMLGGDFGVWSAIVIYILCTVNTFWWGQGLWAVGFVLMGVPGGGIFTYRSWRRLRQIRRREVKLP